jgi:hypothetical protein
MRNNHLVFLLIIASFGCNNVTDQKVTDQTTEKLENANPKKGSFAYDAAFLHQNNKSTIELTSETGGKVLLSAAYQGRVMTSSANGNDGDSYGWINYRLIESGEKKPQFNPAGGEERFWLGPEGGQYALYFKSPDSFNIAHWQVPSVIDTDSFEVKEQDDSHALFFKRATLKNYSGSVFNIDINRKISVLKKQALEEKLHTIIPANIRFIGYESENSITNTGKEKWEPERGLLSIWLLGMFTPTGETKVIIPFKENKRARSFITDNYFGTVPADRLRVTDSCLYFTCDGKYRSKIGLSPGIAMPIASSFDFSRNLLTFIMFSVEEHGMYVNSKWELQKEPYKGDVVNAYNDGPLADGSQMGPFYEIESSSSARPLKTGETQSYKQVTCHFQGEYQELRKLALAVLHVDLDSIKK